MQYSTKTEDLFSTVNMHNFMDQGVIEIACTDLSTAILREDSKQLRPFSLRHLARD